MIELGSEVKCQITGFKGVAIGRYEFLNGCARYCVQPKVGKDGKLPEEKTFDEPQLKVTKQPVIYEIEPAKPKKKTGGPAPYLPQKRYEP